MNIKSAATFFISPVKAATVLWLTIIVSVVLAVFLPRILEQNDFRTDDYYLLSLVQEKGIVAPWDGEQYYYFAAFRPVPMASLLIDFHMFGTSPSGYYFANLGIHLMATLLLFMLLLSVFRIFFNDPSPAVPALFAIAASVHADMFYNVLWICNRTESMLLLFSVMFLLVSVRYFESGRQLYALLAVFLLILALATKAQAIALPLLFLGAGYSFHKAGKLRAGIRSLLLWSIPLLASVALYLIVWMVFDRYEETISLSWLPTKAFSLVAITSIVIHPAVGKALYLLFYEQRAAAALLGILLLAVCSVLLYRMKPEKRGVFLAATALYALALLPRAMHQINTRINTLQIVLFILAAAVISRSFGRRASAGLAIVLTVAYLAGMPAEIAEWRRETDNARYVSLLKEEARGGAGQYALLASYQRFDPYTLHYYRYGAFGCDSSMTESPLRVLRKYYTRAKKEYLIDMKGNVITLRAADPRAGFMYDSSVALPTWMHVELKDEARDYGYRTALIELGRVPPDTRLLLERGYAYENVVIAQ